MVAAVVTQASDGSRSRRQLAGSNGGSLGSSRKQQAGAEVAQDKERLGKQSRQDR